MQVRIARTFISWLVYLIPLSALIYWKNEIIFPNLVIFESLAPTWMTLSGSRSIIFKRTWPNDTCGLRMETYFFPDQVFWIGSNLHWYWDIFAQLGLEINLNELVRNPRFTFITPWVLAQCGAWSALLVFYYEMIIRGMITKVQIQNKPLITWSTS